MKKKKISMYQSFRAATILRHYDYDYAEFYCCDINSQWVTFREFVRRIDILFMLMLV